MGRGAGRRQSVVRRKGTARTAGTGRRSGAALRGGGKPGEGGSGREGPDTGGELRAVPGPPVAPEDTPGSQGPRAAADPPLEQQRERAVHILQ